MNTSEMGPTSLQGPNIGKNRLPVKLEGVTVVCMVWIECDDAVF